MCPSIAYRLADIESQALEHGLRTADLLSYGILVMSTILAPGNETRQIKLDPSQAMSGSPARYAALINIGMIMYSYCETRSIT